MSTTNTLLLPANKNGPLTAFNNRWFRDTDGAIATTKHRDELLQVTLNWTDRLASGETVSSAAYEDSGVTRSGVSVSTPSTICSVTGLGEFEVEVTTSASRKMVERVRFYDFEGPGARERDYR